MPEDDDSENSIGTDLTSDDWGGGDDDRDFAEEAENERHAQAEYEEALEPEPDAERPRIDKTARERHGIPSGRLVVLYVSGDDTVLRAALQVEDHEKAVQYFEVFRTQGHTVQVVASAPSPR